MKYQRSVGVGPSAWLSRPEDATPGGAFQVLLFDSATGDIVWSNRDDLIGSAGETNTASNLGGGVNVFAQKAAADLEFKSLVAGTNVTITGDATGVTINAVGGSDIVNDLSPELGNHLDVNGFSIVSTSAGDIAITPDTIGDVILDGLKWPQADGAASQVLQTNGAGQLAWTTLASGLADIVLDLTPQLGAELDLNGFTSLYRGSDPAVEFVGAVSSVDYVSLQSAVTGNAVSIKVAGNTANVDLELYGKGTGSVVSGRFKLDSGGSLDVGLGEIISAVGSDDNIVLLPDGSGSIVLAQNNWPTTDGTNTQTLQTNGTGLLYWATAGETNTASNLGAGVPVFAQKTASDLEFKGLVAGTNITLTADTTGITINSSSGGMDDLVDDTSPQLGGDLAMNGFEIVNPVFEDSSTLGAFNCKSRSAEPSSPNEGDIYLDDGTNSGSGYLGFRYYDGITWEDIGYSI